MGDLLHTLADEDRRRILFRLLTEDQVVVPEYIESRTRPDRELRLAFHHSHLPKLEDTGLVAVDYEDTVVERGQAFSEARPLIEFLAQWDDQYQLETPGWRATS